MSRQRQKIGPIVWMSVSALVVLVIVASLITLVSGGDTLPREDDAAPAFALASPDGTVVSLEAQVQQHDAVVLVFYRGYF